MRRIQKDVGPKFVELTADVVRIIFLKYFSFRRLLEPLWNCTNVFGGEPTWIQCWKKIALYGYL